MIVWVFFAPDEALDVCNDIYNPIYHFVLYLELK